MKILDKSKTIKLGLFLGLILLLAPLSIQAQRFGGGAGAHRGGGGMSRPAPSHSAPNRSNFSNQSGASHQTINGGSRNSSRTKPEVMPSPKVDRSGTIQRTTNRASTSDVKNNVSGNKNIKNKTKNNNVGNKVDVDRNRNNVNINVDKSKNLNIHNTRNTVVVAPTRAYVRPPYYYGGRGYYSFHPYYYHPYRPFYWGPVWHPWGFFIATIATTAIIVSIENQRYYYDQGVYYIQSNGGYTVVEAPVGATITQLPQGTETVKVDQTTNNYYYGGSYYEKDGEKYKVVPPTAGTIVPSLPEGGEEVKIGEQTYVQFGETYYQPVQVDGKDMYEVVEVKEE